jgi:hypothetical protein
LCKACDTHDFVFDEIVVVVVDDCRVRKRLPIYIGDEKEDLLLLIGLSLLSISLAKSFSKVL